MQTSPVSMSNVIESTKSGGGGSGKNGLLHLADYLRPVGLSTPLKGIDRLYYINLDASTERRRHIESVLAGPAFAGVPATRVAAVDGRDPGFRVEDHFVFHTGAQQHPRMMNTEYATTVSHLNAIRKFVEDVEEADLAAEDGSDPVALILEDDISPEFIPYWKSRLGELAGQAPGGWEILQLSYCLFDFTPGATFEAWEMRKNMCGAIAYMIRYSGACRLIDYLCQYSNPAMFRYYIDGQYPYFHQADRLLYTFLRTYGVNPPPFTYRDSNDSTIHPDHVDFHAKSKERTKKLWCGLDATEGASL